MMRKAIFAGLPVFLLVAACSGDATSGDNTAADSTTLQESSDAPIPEAGGDNAAPVEEASAAPEEGPIPAAFIGVWDYVGGSCDPASDMRLEISQESLVFYESVGQVRSAQTEDDTLRVDLAMSGEGETWRDQMQFTLMDDGTLHMVNAATPDALDEYPRKRCEG